MQTDDPDSNTWSGRFSEPVDELVKHYTASVSFDKRLAEFDIQGSLAHARMLAKTGVVSAQDFADIERGLRQILEEVQAGRFPWSLDLEDVHLNIEKRLTDLVGDAGKRLHTGRSRNDQVATDVRLWLRAAIDVIDLLIRALQIQLVDLAEQHTDTVMPGFTHLQVAQPVTFGHHLMAYFEMFRRDRGRLADCRRRVNRLPLGAAALAGTSYPIDREMVANASWASTAYAKTRWTRCRIATSPSSSPPRGTAHDPPVALVRRADPVDEPALRLRQAGRPLLHRLLDHAAEEKPGRARAGARQDRARQRPSGRAADPDERRSRWPTTRTTRKTRSRCSIPWTR